MSCQSTYFVVKLRGVLSYADTPALVLVLALVLVVLMFDVWCLMALGMAEAVHTPWFIGERCACGSRRAGERSSSRNDLAMRMARPLLLPPLVVPPARARHVCWVSCVCVLFACCRWRRRRALITLWQLARSPVGKTILRMAPASGPGPWFPGVSPGVNSKKIVWRFCTIFYGLSYGLFSRVFILGIVLLRPLFRKHDVALHPALPRLANLWLLLKSS